jgi:hypothetical protein
MWCQSGILSNRWCAALKPSGVQPLLKFSNPLQNTRNPTTEDNYNLYTQIVIVKTGKKEKKKKKKKRGNGE